MLFQFPLPAAHPRPVLNELVLLMPLAVGKDVNWLLSLRSQLKLKFRLLRVRLPPPRPPPSPNGLGALSPKLWVSRRNRLSLSLSAAVA